MFTERKIYIIQYTYSRIRIRIMSPPFSTLIYIFFFFVLTRNAPAVFYSLPH